MEAEHLRQLLRGLVQDLGQQEDDNRSNQNQDLVRPTRTCDGSDGGSARNCIREVSLALNRVAVRNTAEIVPKTGPLRFELVSECG